jgi:putative toxin-antitoxin system antitoxin component (TIGR02293 family)
MVHNMPYDVYLHVICHSSLRNSVTILMVSISSTYGIMKLKMSSMASHSYTLLDVHRDIQKGYRLSCAMAVAERLGITDVQLAELLGVSIRTLQRVPDSKSPLSAQMSDRLYRLARIVAMAEYVLEGADSARVWMHEHQRALGGAKPLELISSEAGYREVEDLLGRIEYGVYS